MAFGRAKKLKKIPADVVSYVLIEGEAIKDANDKMLIVSYAQNKLKTIEWYLELLDVDSEKYIVPHSKVHLERVKSELLAAIKKVMDTKIPSPSDSIISIKYPKGYEG